MISREFFLSFPLFRSSQKKSLELIPKLVLSLAILKPSTLVLPKTIVDNFYKSIVALSTRPFEVGNRIKIDRYEGVVRNVSFWYLTLEKSRGYVFIPTSHVYDSVIELYE
jgi:hypothetical protein